MYRVYGCWRPLPTHLQLTLLRTSASPTHGYMANPVYSGLVHVQR